MTDPVKANYTVYRQGHEMQSAEARAQYVALLRKQGRLEPELEDAILNDKSITAARRQEIEIEEHRAKNDQDWQARWRRGDQEARSQNVNWAGWKARRVEG